MRKPLFHAIFWPSLAASAFFLGVCVANVVALRSPVAVPMSAPSGVKAPAAQPRTAQVESWPNPFAPSDGVGLPSKVVKSSGPAGTEAAAPRTNYLLIGTVASDNASLRRAILWNDGMKSPRSVKEKEEIEPSVKMGAISRDHAFLLRGKEKEKLDLLPVGTRQRPSTATLAATAPPPADVRPPRGEGGLPSSPEIKVSKIREGQYAIDEASIASITSDFNKHMTQVRLQPYFDDGKAAGYRLVQVRPGSTFSQIGFQSGDVLQQVNGLDVSSPDKLFTLFQNLKDEKRVVVNLLRGGQSTTMSYEIR